MKTKEPTRTRRAAFAAEGGGWTALRRPELGLAGKTAVELLSLTAALPGNLRYALTPDGGVILIGEIRGSGGAETFEDARERLHGWLDGTSADAPAPAAEALEAALDASGYAWAKREKGWAVPANENLPRELQISVTPHGVRVEAILADWEQIGDVEGQALAAFLVGAQSGLRFARCEMDAISAHVVSTADAAHLDADLAHALTGVAVGCRLLAREAATLLVPEAARAFLEFHQTNPAAAC